MPWDPCHFALSFDEEFRFVEGSCELLKLVLVGKYFSRLG